MALAKTYIQSMNGGKVFELLDSFNIYTGNVPFKSDVKVKQPSKNSWHDEHGDEEYVPDDGLRYEAYEMTFEVGYKGGFQTAEGVKDAFVESLRQLGEFKICCDYNRKGRTHVRFVSMSRPTLEISDEEEGDIYKWNLTLKVNDPVTSWVPDVWEPVGIVSNVGTGINFAQEGGSGNVTILLVSKNPIGAERRTLLRYGDYGGETIPSNPFFTVAPQSTFILVRTDANNTKYERSGVIRITYMDWTLDLLIKQPGLPMISKG